MWGGSGGGEWRCPNLHRKPTAGCSFITRTRALVHPFSLTALVFALSISHAHSHRVYNIHRQRCDIRCSGWFVSGQEKKNVSHAGPLCKSDFPLLHIYIYIYIQISKGRPNTPSGNPSSSSSPVSVPDASHVHVQPNDAHQQHSGIECQTFTLIYGFLGFTGIRD